MPSTQPSEASSAQAASSAATSACSQSTPYENTISVLLRQLSDSSTSGQSLNLDYLRNFLSSTLGWERKNALKQFKHQLQLKHNFVTLANHLRMQEQGKYASYPLILRDTYAQQVTILVHPRPLRIANGQKSTVATLSLGTGVDFTHEQLERQRLTLLAILDRLPEFVALIAPDFRIRYINKPFREQIQLKVGDSCYRAFTGHTEDIEAPSHPYLPPFDVFETGSPSFSAWKSPRSGRSYRFLSYPFTDTDGSPLILLMGLDITQLTRFQEKLEITERQYHLITNNLSLGIAVVDDQRNITAANRQFREWFKLYTTTYPATCPSILTERNKAGECVLDKTAALTMHDSKEHEHEFTTMLEHTEVTFRLTACPLHRTKQFSSVIILLEDITEKQKIAQRTQQMRKLEAMSTLTTGIAHEINQPLSALRLYASGLEMMVETRDDIPKDILQERLGWILRETATIQDIITHMRSLVRPQDKLPLQPSNVNDAVVHSLALLHPKLESRSITVTTTLEDTLPLVLALPIQLEQVIINIVMNAAHALETVNTPRTIRIETTTQDEQFVQLNIEDNGPGITGLGDKIFDPFFTTKESGKNMGLGLSLVHTFITSWNGTISAHSPQESNGTHIVILLPRHQAA